jgi:enoyl-CoA hydratase
MMSYVPPPELLVESDGPVTIVTMNNPEMRNAFVDPLHDAMREVWGHIGDDPACKVAILTGAGRAFSAGGNVPGFIRDYDDFEHRRRSLRNARKLMDAMAEFHKPLIAAVNGPAVGLGASIVALCDIVYMAESAHLADPHILVGLVGGDGAAITWPLLMSLHLAKEYALTGDRIPAERAAAIGLANHVVPDDEVFDQAMACAQRIAKLPQQATQDTLRAINMHLERAVLATLDYAFSAEERSFTTPEMRERLDRLMKRSNE